MAHEGKWSSDRWIEGKCIHGPYRCQASHPSGIWLDPQQQWWRMTPQHRSNVFPLTQQSGPWTPQRPETVTLCRNSWPKRRRNVRLNAEIQHTRSRLVHCPQLRRSSAPKVGQEESQNSHGTIQCVSLVETIWIATPQESQNSHGTVHHASLVESSRRTTAYDDREGLGLVHPHATLLLRNASLRHCELNMTFLWTTGPNSSYSPCVNHLCELREGVGTCRCIATCTSTT